MGITPFNTLFADLRLALKKGALGHQQFLPLDELDRLVTVEQVELAIPEWNIFRPSGLAQDVVHSAHKIFAILSFIGEPIAIKNLWLQGLRDEHLPLKVGENPDAYNQLMTLDGSRVFEAWGSAAKAVEFVDKQWLLLAPIFDTTGHHHQLDNNCSMPFVTADEVSGGAFSWVHMCEIHQAHHEGLKVENGKAFVAVKQFKIKGNPKAFQQEKSNLKMIEDLNHPHIIRHHATCELDDSYFVIFPWADGGSLSDYWESNNPTSRSPDLALWILEQMLGVAEVLEALHHRKFRHGDLKPDNILHFNSTTSESTLVIGDVGVSRVHKEDTFMRKNKTTTAATTPSYQAPEVDGDPNIPRSRKYDMWSIGCIFLEMIVWFLWKNQAIVAFQHKRAAPDRCSYFYKKESDGSLEVHPMVAVAISTLLEDPRVTNDTIFGKLLALIRDDLLRADVAKRSTASEFVAKLRLFVESARSKELSIYETDAAFIPVPEVFHLKGNQPAKHGPKDSVIDTSDFNYTNT